MIKVLIVDDEKIIHVMLRSIFKKQQDLKIIRGVFNGEEAIKFIRQKTPDAIIMDINMPIMDGMEATKKITSTMPNVPIVALSLHKSTTVKKNMLEVGASAYVTKDQAVKNLCATIRKVVNSTKSHLN